MNAATPEQIRRVLRARQAVLTSERVLREEIRGAFYDRAGFTVEDIALAAGLTKQRVYQIVREMDGQEPSA